MLLNTQKEVYNYWQDWKEIKIKWFPFCWLAGGGLRRCISFEAGGKWDSHCRSSPARHRRVSLYPSEHAGWKPVPDWFGRGPPRKKQLLFEITENKRRFHQKLSLSGSAFPSPPSVFFSFLVEKLCEGPKRLSPRESTVSSRRKGQFFLKWAAKHFLHNNGLTLVTFSGMYSTRVTQPRKKKHKATRGRGSNIVLPFYFFSRRDKKKLLRRFTDF